MKESSNIYANIDYKTIIVFLILVTFGWMNIFSSAYTSEDVKVFNFTTRYGKQMLWIGVAIIIVILLFFVETYIISFLSYYLYGFIMLMLVGVLIFGTTVNESRSWFELFGFRIQPAEFAKFATAIALAKYMNDEKFSFNNMKDFVIASAIIAVPAILILLQNDTGSAIVFSVFLLVLFREGLHYIFLLLIFLAVFLFILSFYLSFDVMFFSTSIILFLLYAYYTANTKVLLLMPAASLLLSLAMLLPVVLFSLKIPNYLIIIIATVIPSIYYIIKTLQRRIFIVLILFLIYIGSIMLVFSVDYIFNNFLSDYQQDRIEVFLGLLDDERGIGYNVNQSKISIGSGGISGKGFLQGTQTKFDFVPEQDTDFIFCTIGEEWGFWGTGTFIILFLFLISRIITIAERQRSRYSRVFGYSVAGIFFFHFGVNIAMTIGLAPVIGIPLPFISYGGSSLWAFTILLFVLLRLDISREEII